MRLSLCYPDAPQFWIGVDGMGDDPILDAEISVPDQVANHGLIIVERDVREGRAAFHVAKRPNPRDVGFQPRVCLDVSTAIGPVLMQVPPR
jgi:hypothetical protein